jgi:hypothetical protein
MEGLTIREIAEQLGITPINAKFRLLRFNIEPTAKAGRTNIYDPSVVDIIRNVPPPGRPKKHP